MDKVKKVVVEATKTTSKQKLISIGASVIEWLTKGKIEKNTVIALAGLGLATAANIGPYEKAPMEALEAVNKGLTEMVVSAQEQHTSDSLSLVEYQNQINALKEKAKADSIAAAPMYRWFGITR